MRNRTLVLAIAIVAILATASQATWSLILVDTKTKEIAIGTVTCVENDDLLAWVPVIVVGKGGAVAQARSDLEGTRRPLIFEELKNGTPPDVILEMLAGFPLHYWLQYGIVDTMGRAITFTGGGAPPWKGGVIGQSGDLVYAIAGNILAGSCVVPAIEQAILDTPGDLPEKLMAGHVAARNMGGDGRCSCSQVDPTSCGCPPFGFAKSGHNGCMVVARIGDTDDTLCDVNGCADGDYFMTFNVAHQFWPNPDPVDQLQSLFDAWRADLIGRPDAMQSLAVFDRTALVPGKPGTAELVIMLLDWQSLPITVPIESISVQHAPDSAGITSIGPIVDDGDGNYRVTITHTPTPNPTGAPFAEGVDRFRIVVDDGIRPVSLMPDPALHVNRWASPAK